MSEAQVYALIRSGDLPAVKIGGRGVWRIERARLEEWVQRLYRETEPATAGPSEPEATSRPTRPR